MFSRKKKKTISDKVDLSKSMPAINDIKNDSFDANRAGNLKLPMKSGVLYSTDDLRSSKQVGNIIFCKYFLYHFCLQHSYDGSAGQFSSHT